MKTKSVQPAQPAPLPRSDRNLPDELLRRVRQIEMSTRRLVNEVASGQYRTHFKGHGVQFSEHRLYVAGDDVRHIDWKVSARTRDPLVKKYEEERELNVLLVIDVSGSSQFGSRKQLKSDVIAQVAGLIAYAAVHTGDKIGALLFAGGVEKIIPPKKGRTHVLRIVREVLGFDPDQVKHPGTRLDIALDSAGRVMKHSGVVFVISDFLSQGYETALRRLARKHDVVALEVTDPNEKKPAFRGLVSVVDPETGDASVVDMGGYRFQTFLDEFRRTHEGTTDTALKRSQVEFLSLSTQEDYGEAVVRFFKRRKARRSATR